MKYNSKKRKFLKLQNQIRLKILKAFKPNLVKQDVDIAKEGQSGPDIILSRRAKKLCPYQYEIKSQNRMATVYKWFDQASKKTRLNPVVVMKANGRDPLVVLDVDHFFDLIK